MLYFITGNKKKFEEAKAILGVEIEQLDIDLPEIQDIDPHNIIKEKLQEALHHHKGLPVRKLTQTGERLPVAQRRRHGTQTGPFIVDDVSLELAGLGGLPGPFIKWFLETLGAEGIHELAENTKNTEAEAKLIIGYASDEDNIHFFEGAIKGSIVEPRSDGFGWDPIFQPKGSTKTFAEMGPEEKNKISHRRIALDKLKEFLEKDEKE